MTMLTLNDDIVREKRAKISDMMIMKNIFKREKKQKIIHP